MSSRYRGQDGTGVIHVVPGYGITLAAGPTPPADGRVGYAPGCLFIDIDAAGGSQVYVNEGTKASADFNLLTGVGLSGLTATATELNRLDDDNAVMSVAAGTGITGGTGTVYKSSVLKSGDLYCTRIYIDLTGLDAVATDGDIIGAAGTNPAHLGRIVAARNGTVDVGMVTCLEAPAGASADINLASAVEATGKKDDAISGLTGTQTLVDAGGSWTNGLVKGILNTPVTANNYLYLTNGAGASAGTYTAGKFLIELYGY